MARKETPAYLVRNSAIHGRGVFAARRIRAGTTVIEYTGERISWRKALRRHPHDPAQPNHTFYFSLEDGRVIDANVGGNDARWINHGCDPNCEAEEESGARAAGGSRVFIRALRDIARGEELKYDYGLLIDARYTKKLKDEYRCLCGAADCRGTMLAPKAR
jgi:SET domain-containing protein